MNVAHIEHKDACRESAPSDEFIDRLEDLIKRRNVYRGVVGQTEKSLKALQKVLSAENFELSGYRRDLVNQRSAAAHKVADLKGKIVEVAVLLVAEAENEELIPA